MRIKKVSDQSALDSYFETMSNFNKGAPPMGSDLSKVAIKVSDDILRSSRSALQNTDLADIARTNPDAIEGLKKLLGAADDAQLATKFTAMQTEVGAVFTKLDAGVAWPSGCEDECAKALFKAIKNNMPPGSSNQDVADFMVAAMGSAGDTVNAAKLADNIAGAPTLSRPSALTYEELARSKGLIPDGPTPTPRPTPPGGDPPAPRPTPPGGDPPASGLGGALDKNGVELAAKNVSDLAKTDVVAAAKVIEELELDDAVKVLKKMSDSDTDKIMKQLMKTDTGKARAAKIIGRAAEAGEDITAAGWLRRLNPMDQKFILRSLVPGKRMLIAGGLLALGVTIGPDLWDVIMDKFGEGDEDEPSVHGPGSPDYVHPQTQDAVTNAERGNWEETQNILRDIQKSGDRELLRKTLERLASYVYDKDYYIELVPPYSFGSGRMSWVFVNSSKWDNEGAVSVAREFLSKRRGADMVVYEAANQSPGMLGGGNQFTSFEEFAKAVPDGQIAVNEAFELLLDYSLGSGLVGPGSGSNRAKRITRDDRIGGKPGAGVASRGKHRLTRKERRRQRDLIRELSALASEDVDSLLKNSEMFKESNMNNEKRFNLLKKLATQASNSTNINLNDDNSRLSKKADDFSKAYYKDAVTDLSNSDQYLRSYFAGLGRLYDEKSETPKGDYKTLYNVHDETGADLVNSAHPKAIVVSDSIGRGGLVENGLEQQRQTQDVAFSSPTGNYRANYAWLRDSFKKTS